MGTHSLSTGFSLRNPSEQPLGDQQLVSLDSAGNFFDAISSGTGKTMFDTATTETIAALRMSEDMKAHSLVAPLKQPDMWKVDGSRVHDVQRCVCGHSPWYLSTDEAIVSQGIGASIPVQ